MSRSYFIVFYLWVLSVCAKGNVHGSPGTNVTKACEPFAIENPSFETVGLAWAEWGSGFQYNQDQYSDGVMSIRVVNGGAYQVFYFPAGTIGVAIGAESLPDGVGGSYSDDYSIFCDFELQDGSWEYGIVAHFDPTLTEWHAATLVHSNTQAIVEGWCYAMFQNYESGSAYFDNFHACTENGSS